MGWARALAHEIDCVAFARDAGLPDPDPWQIEAMRSRAHRSLWNIHRQGGKSTVAGVLAAHTALYRPGSLTLCVSPSLRQSAELFRKVLLAWRAAGRPVPAESESKLSIELETGSRVLSLPGSEATVRGYSAPDLIVIDEASRVEDDLMAALRPMQATNAGRARMVAISTPWGRRGWWHEAWQDGGDEWVRVRVPATECPRITPEFLASERRSLGEMKYRSEYLCEFVDAAGVVFDADLLREAVTRDVLPLWGESAPPLPGGAAPLFGGPDA